jgi:hypothetical protein
MKIKDITEGIKVLTANGQSVVHKRHDNGVKFCWKFIFSNGAYLIATLEHPAYNPELNKWIELGDYKPGDKALFRDGRGEHEVITFVEKVEHGFDEVYDLTVGGELENENSNYYANGILVHNCLVYSLNGFWCGFYKSNYPHEFLIANMKHARSSGKMTETEFIAELIKEAREMGIKVNIPTFQKARIEPWYSKQDGCVYLGVGSIKGIGEVAAGVLVDATNKTANFKEFCDYCINAKVETGRMRKDGTPILRPLVNKGHINTLVCMGFFGEIKEVVPEYTKLFKEEVEIKSDAEMVNEALGFDYYSPFEGYRAKLPDHLQDQDKYLVIKVIETKSGQKNGRKWHMLKANSEIGQITAFMDSVAGIDKGDTLLVEYSKGKSDALSIRSYKLL